MNGLRAWMTSWRSRFTNGWTKRRKHSIIRKWHKRKRNRNKRKLRRMLPSLGMTRQMLVSQGRLRRLLRLRRSPRQLYKVQLRSAQPRVQRPRSHIAGSLSTTCARSRRAEASILASSWPGSTAQHRRRASPSQCFINHTSKSV